MTLKKGKLAFILPAILAAALALVLLEATYRFNPAAAIALGAAILVVVVVRLVVIITK